jgi:2-C-methyl-D-erythritol 4-phosphate cytidylyltransferase
MHQYVIIVAGGSGSRMKSAVPKQFLEIGGVPVLMRTISRFYQYNNAINIILVLPESDIATWQNLCQKHSFRIPIQVTKGGTTRFESVKNGLALIDNDDAVVAVHDGVRPFVSLEVIANSFNQAATYGNAVVAVALKDSIRRVERDQSIALNRNDFKLVQTPQVFRVDIIKKAYSVTEGTDFTDDASVVEAAGITIKLVEGSYENIKITTPEDLFIAEALLRLQSEE